MGQKCKNGLNVNLQSKMLCNLLFHSAHQKLLTVFLYIGCITLLQRFILNNGSHSSWAPAVVVVGRASGVVSQDAETNHLLSGGKGGSGKGDAGKESSC